MTIVETQTRERKIFLAALIGLVLLALVNWLASRAGPETRPDAELTGERVFSETFQTPRIIAITLADETYSLENSEQGWIMPERAGFPIEAGKVTAMLTAIETAWFMEPRTALSARHELLGLGHPDTGGNGALVRLPDTDTEGVILGVREDNPFGRQAGDDQSYRLSTSFPALHSPAWWLDFDAIGLPRFRQIAQVEVTGPDGDTLSELRAGDPLSMDEEALFFASQTVQILDVMGNEQINSPSLGEHSLVYQDGTELSFTLYQHQRGIWAVLSGSALPKSELTEGRVFRLDPIGASELLP